MTTSIKRAASQLVTEARKVEANNKLMCKFSKYALLQLAEATVIEYGDKATMPELINAFVDSLQGELEDNLQNCKLDLESALDEDADIDETTQGDMKPDEKVKAYLESTCGVIGFTDDILKAVSAAYGIVLEPNLY